MARLVVCNPRKNALLKKGNKSDRIDARKLAELLPCASSRSYLALVKDVTGDESNQSPVSQLGHKLTRGTHTPAWELNLGV